MKLSIIVPSYNDHRHLDHLISDIVAKAFKPESVELIIVDGRSNDETFRLKSKAGLKFIESEVRQRAFQMNLGANEANGDILYFLHADSQLPIHFDELIVNMCQNDDCGCFRMKFDLKNTILSFYSFFTKFSHEVFHAGDASLFIRKECFNQLEGFDERWQIMEDYEFNKRLRKAFKFKVIDEYIVTSARKYETNGILRLQWHFLILQLMFRSGKSQQKLLNYYNRHVQS